MKNLKKLLIAIAVVAIAVCAITVSASAVNFTGNLATLNEHINSADKLSDAANKMATMNTNVRIYLLSRPVDPLTEGFDKAMDTFDSVTADIISGYVEKCNAYPLENVDEADMAKNLAARKALIEELCVYLNKLREVKFYYAPTESGDGVEPVENKYGATYFYNPNGDKAMSARKLLNASILEIASVLIEGLEGVADLNNLMADMYFETYAGYKAAEGDEKEALLNKLTADADSLIQNNTAFRADASVLFVFLRDCPIEADALRPSAKHTYNRLLQTLGQTQYYELKSNAAAYFAYDFGANNYGVNGTSKHNVLNAAADRVTVLLSKYKSTISKSADDYDKTMTLVDEVKSSIEAKNNQKKLELEYNTPLSEYILTGGQHRFDMEDGKFAYTLWHGEASTTGAGNGSTLGVGTDPDTGNKYAEFILGKDKGEDGINAQQPSSVAYIDMKLGDTSNGYIIEFDVMTKSDSFKAMQLGFAEYAFDGARVGTEFFTTNNGVIQTNRYTSIKFETNAKTAFDGAITPGEWTHITLIYKPDNGQGIPVATIYVDYEWIGYWWSVAQSSAYKLTTLRIQPGANHYNLCMDNMLFYQGTGYRDIDKLKGMSDVELYKYYTGIYINANYSPQNRDYALNQAEVLYESVKNDSAIQSEKLVASIYNSSTGQYVDQEFTYSEILTKFLENRNAYILDAAIAQVKEQLMGTVGDAFTTAVTSKNLDTVKSLINGISNFLKDNAAYIQLDDPDVIDIKQNINRVNKDITRIENVVKLIEALQKFDRATTVASMVKRFEDVNKWYNASELYDSSVYELVKNDPAVISYEETLELESDTALLDHIAGAQPRIDKQRVQENTQKIVNCIDIITSMKGYTPTEEFFSLNEEYIDRYVTSIRSVLVSGVYDPSYKGLDQALSEFEIIYPYFYSRLQDKHATAIKERLDIYPTTDSFITRLGVCSFVENYIKDNDVDFEHEAIIPLIEIYEVYKREMESLEEDYSAAIEENTYHFINLAKRMQATNSYKELKVLCDEAAQAICLMNVSSEEAKNAIAIYDYYRVLLEAKEEIGRLFVEEATKLKYVKTNKDIYAILVLCAQYVEDVDIEVKGVENALNTYNEKLAEYKAGINPTNELLEETSEVVLSVRTISINSVILEIVKSLFSK